jgi:NRPS condensation-like uncharacterized protein
MDDPDYSPKYKIDGNRGFQIVISEIRFIDKVRALLFQGKDSNQTNFCKFPFSTEENISPFILTHEISSSRYSVICEYCKNLKVTINDVVLAAYYRTISKTLNMDGKPLSIPIMVDMRRYLKDKSFKALSNMSSTVITNITIKPEEAFRDTVLNINNEMNIKKSKNIGLNGFIKLALIFKIFSDKMSYKLIERGIKNPYICTTNIGILDSKKLVFQGSLVDNAFMCGSIKYRPHFQLALSSFQDKITFTSNLYGSEQDKEAYTHFLAQFDKELPQ